MNTNAIEEEQQQITSLIESNGIEMKQTRNRRRKSKKQKMTNQQMKTKNFLSI